MYDVFPPFLQTQNLRQLLTVYEVWLDQILPAKAIEDNIETVEKLGHKVAVKVSMKFSGGKRDCGVQPF